MGLTAARLTCNFPKAPYATSSIERTSSFSIPKSAFVRLDLFTGAALSQGTFALSFFDFLAGSLAKRCPQEGNPIVQVALFNQLLQHFPRTEFAALVKKHAAERDAKGFTCWSSPCLFCQLGRADSLREICSGLGCCLGRVDPCRHCQSALPLPVGTIVTDQRERTVRYLINRIQVDCRRILKSIEW
ncbi:MAG: DUF4372 domain-containing protein [Acidobacteriia bacterium]|nr:DUF4372 domain-containing protein [Terriglobia bacterium]